MEMRTHGQHRPRQRQTLNPTLADALLRLHIGTGESYRRVARTLDLDLAMWWRLTRGQRCPSPEAAERIIERLELDTEIAEELRMAASQTSAAAAWA